MYENVRSGPLFEPLKWRYQRGNGKFWVQKGSPKHPNGRTPNAGRRTNTHGFLNVSTQKPLRGNKNAVTKNRSFRKQCYSLEIARNPLQMSESPFSPCPRALMFRNVTSKIQSIIIFCFLKTLYFFLFREIEKSQLSRKSHFIEFPFLKTLCVSAGLKSPICSNSHLFASTLYYEVQ